MNTIRNLFGLLMFCSMSIISFGQSKKQLKKELSVFKDSITKLQLEISDKKNEIYKLQMQSEDQLAKERIEHRRTNDSLIQKINTLENSLAQSKNPPKETQDKKSISIKGESSNPFDAESKTTQQSNNPFGDGGSGASRGGGRGGGFGSDDGNHGTGRGGIVDGKGRKRLPNELKVDHIQTVVDVTIHLKLTINASGEVISAANIASKTNTTDQRIINQVISAVKSQVKYSKDPDAGLELVYLTVKVNAQ